MSQVFIFLFCLILGKTLALTINHNKHTNDYSYIGDYCTPTQFAKLPCLQQFCAEIDYEMQAWAANNISVASKLEQL